LSGLLQQQVVPVQVATFGANGSPLDVVGQITVPIIVSGLNCTQLFTVVRQLSVAGILGADFLVKHGALIDCRNSRLLLGDPQTTVPVEIVSTSQTPVTVSSIVALANQEIPGRSAKVIRCRLDGCDIQSIEGFVEPLQSCYLPKYVLVGRSVSVVSQQELIIPMINIGPSAITVYKGTRLASFVPIHDVLLLEQKDVSPQEPFSEGPDININLESADLTEKQKSQMHQLLTEFSDVFSVQGGPLGRTDVVKHAIATEGRPVRQPPRRLPESLKPVVNSEVDKMSQGVIRNSTSPWSSPIVMVQKKDGSWRFCIDFRKVNSLTHKDAYPLPRINETLDSLAGGYFFQYSRFSFGVLASRSGGTGQGEDSLFDPVRS